MFGKGKMGKSASSKFVMAQGRAVGNIKAPVKKAAKPATKAKKGS